MPGFYDRFEDAGQYYEDSFAAEQRAAEQAADYAAWSRQQLTIGNNLYVQEVAEAISVLHQSNVRPTKPFLQDPYWDLRLPDRGGNYLSRRCSYSISPRLLRKTFIIWHANL